MFLAPLDEVRGWWRYHHLFADLLRARLQDEQPGRVPQLHRTAAAWYEEHGLADDAIRHAVAASDMTWAARLIEQHFDAVFYLRGEAATIQRWISALPDDLVRSRSRLLLAQAQMANASGRAGAAGPLLDAAERASEARPLSHSSLLRAGCQPAGERRRWHRDRAARTSPRSAGMPRLRRGSPRGLWMSSAKASTATFPRQVLMAVALRLRGQLAEAERDPGLRHRRVAGGRPAHRDRVGLLSPRPGSARAGSPGRGRADLPARAGDHRRAGRPPLPAAGPAYVGLAQVAYQRNELDVALGHVTEGIALCRQFVHTAPLAEGLMTLAWIRQASGDPAGALDAIGAAMQAAPGPGGLLNPVPAQRAWLQLAQGDLAEAARWTQENGLGPGDEPDYLRELGHLVLAQLLLARECPARRSPCWIACIRRRSTRTGPAA